MGNKIITFLLILIIFYSCHSKRNENVNNKKINAKDLIVSYLGDSNNLRLGKFTKIHLDTICYTNKKIHYIATSINNVANGYCIEFYENNNLKKIFFLKNGLLDGEEKIYDEEGFLQYQGFWRNDMRESFAKFFYKNGNLKTLNHYRGNKEFGSQYFYNTSGKLDSFFFCHAEGGKWGYRRIYDSNGIFSKENGNPIVDFVCSSDLYETGDTVGINIFCAKPPHCNLSFKINELNNSFAEIDLSSDSMIDKTATARFYIIDKPGKYIFVGSCTLTDSVTNKATEYSKTISFLVKKNRLCF